jgi:hypothetical protein
MIEFYSHRRIQENPPFDEVLMRPKERTTLETVIQKAKAARRVHPLIADKLSSAQWHLILEAHWYAIVAGIEILTNGGFSEYTNNLQKADRSRLITEVKTRIYKPPVYGQFGTYDSATLLHDALLGETTQRLPFRFKPLIIGGFKQHNVSVENNNEPQALLRIADEKIHLHLFGWDTQNIARNPRMKEALFQSWGV